MKIINIAQKIGHPQFAKSFASGIVGSKAFGQITRKYGEHYYNILLLLIFLTNDFVEKYAKNWDDTKFKLLQNSISKFDTEKRILEGMKKEWALGILLAINLVIEKEDFPVARKIYFTLINSLFTIVQNYDVLTNENKNPKLSLNFKKDFLIWLDAARLEGAAEGIEPCLIEPLSGSIELAEQLRPSNSSYSSKYPATKLRDIIKNKDAYRKATYSLATYICLKILKISYNCFEENTVTFVNYQTEKIKHSKICQISDSTRSKSYLEIKNLLEQNGFFNKCLLDPSNEIKEIDNFFSIALLSVTVTDTLIYEDPFSYQFACDVIICIINHLINFKKNKDEALEKIEQANQLIDYFCCSTEYDRKLAFLINSGIELDSEGTQFLLSFPLRKAIDIATLATLSRLPVIETKEHLEEFIREELSGAKLGDLSTPAVGMLAHYASKTEKFLNREHSHCVDGPNGPIQALNKFTIFLKEDFSSFSAHIRSCVLLNILEFYEKICNKPSINGDDITSAFADSKDDLEIAREKFKFINNVINGNNYIDSFEKIADEAIKEKLQATNLTLKENIKNYLSSNSKLQATINSLKVSLQNKNQLEQEETKNKLDEMTQLVELSSTEIDQLTEEIRNLQTILHTEQTKIEHLTAENKRLSNRLSTNSSDFGEKSESVKTIINDVIINKGFRLTDYLKLAEVFSNRALVVLPEAYKYIDQSDKFFKQKDRFVQLVFKLAFEYRKIYFEEGDVAARKVFSISEYAAQESDTTSQTSEKRIQSIRTVKYNGREVVMKQHLRIGVSNDVSQCLRIYFFTDSDSKKIVIGYCGPHPINSSST